MRYEMSWKEYNWCIHKIFDEITRMDITFHYIATFPKGGLIPAVHLANLLEIEKILFLPRDELELFTYSLNANMLIIDDISDSGETLEKYKEHTMACICSKRGTKIMPEYNGLLFEDDIWVVFPWESTNSKEMRNRDGI